MDWIEIERENDYKVVACIAEIRCNATGEIREYETEELLFDGEDFPYVFNWEENNNSCDCNRSLYFKRAKNEEINDDDWDTVCSDGKYSVNLKNKLDGVVYYREF